MLTHHETGQEKEGRGHTDSRTEQTTKAGPDCVNKVNSQADKDGQRSMYLANATESTVCIDVHTRWTHFSNMLKLRPSNLTTQANIVCAF